MALTVGNTGMAGLIINGDFQSGNTGFASDYNPSLGIGATEGTYVICDNPHGAAPIRNPSAASYYDHTYGGADGLMMAVNGATTPGLMVWGQTVTGLVPGQQYEFSLWVSTWVASTGSGNAILDIQLNGLSRAVFSAPAIAGVWERRSLTWTATASTAAFAAIFDKEIATYPNDFALDDLSLVPVPEASTFLAGGLMLAPLGWQTVKRLRNHKPRR